MVLSSKLIYFTEMSFIKMNSFLVSCIFFLIVIAESEATGHCFCHAEYFRGIKLVNSPIKLNRCTDFYKPATGGDGTGNCFCACCPEDLNDFDSNYCGPKSHEDEGHKR